MDVGLPLFDRYGAKVTFVVNPPNMQKRLEAWKTAVAHGHEIGNHTTSHPCSGNFAWSRDNALENYTPAMIEQQMDGANAEILRLVGVKAMTFATPAVRNSSGAARRCKAMCRSSPGAFWSAAVSAMKRPTTPVLRPVPGVRRGIRWNEFRPDEGGGCRCFAAGKLAGLRRP